MYFIAKDMTGPTIAVAIAMALKAPNLVIFSSVIVGFGRESVWRSGRAWIAT